MSTAYDPYEPVYDADGVMTMDDTSSIEDRLKAPFPAVKWRLGQVTPKNAKGADGRYAPGSRGKFLCYIDSRDLYDRLDDVVGFGNWTREIVAVHPDQSVTGRLSIRINGEWILHEDIGYPNNPGSDREDEPLKAAASDAFKRAGVGFGIGRYLYTIDAEWHPIDAWGKKIVDTAYETTRQAGEEYRPGHAQPADPPHRAAGPQNAPQAVTRTGGPSEKQLAWLEQLWSDIDPIELDAIASYNDIDLGNLTGGRGGTASKLIDLLRARTDNGTPTF